jgi:hypothetical protein
VDTILLVVISIHRDSISINIVTGESETDSDLALLKQNLATSPSHPPAHFSPGNLNLLSFPTLHNPVYILIRNVIFPLQLLLLLRSNINRSPFVGKALEITTFLFLVLGIAVMAFGGGVLGCEMQTFGFYCCGELISRICVSCSVEACVLGISRVDEFEGRLRRRFS